MMVMMVMMMMMMMMMIYDDVMRWHVMCWNAMAPNCWLDHLGQLCWSLGPSWAPLGPRQLKGKLTLIQEGQIFPLDLAASCHICHICHFQVLLSSELIQIRKKPTSLNLRIFSRTFRSNQKEHRFSRHFHIARSARLDTSTEAATPWMKFIPAKAMFDRMFTITDDLAPFCMFCHPSVTQNSRILTGRILKNRLENLKWKSSNWNLDLQGQRWSIRMSVSSLTYKMRRTWLEKSWIHPVTLIYFTKISQLLLVNLVIWVWK